MKIIRAAPVSSPETLFDFIGYCDQQRMSEEKVHLTRTAASHRQATLDDIRSILGDLDDGKMLPILALQPTIADLEQASVWLGGDPDIFGAAEPLKGTASQIVTILSADDDEEPPRAS